MKIGMNYFFAEKIAGATLHVWTDCSGKWHESAATNEPTFSEVKGACFDDDSCIPRETKI
jgi:hypothetical protein